MRNKEGKTMRLKNKIAIIMGTSSGIGMAGAISLAKEGADILITYRNNKKGALEVKEKINNLGRKCEILKVNLENVDNIKIIISKALEKYSGIDILVNNAGDCKAFEFLDDPIENLDYLLNVDVKSVFLLSQLASKEMIKKNGGTIINITSISGVYVNDTSIISYCAAKAAANMLTKGMAKALTKYNIRVNAILPGVMDTPLTWRTISDDDSVRKSIIDRTPMKMIGQPEDIAEMITFLASDKSRFMTGSLVVMDGGFIL